ncbi:hypothetical protein B0H34DRAFT_538196 [Crassisporium funariophilum]|nr:hypothetical protein B0H34DRAFT_538196 [Crassisporium funariophilum]
MLSRHASLSSSSSSRTLLSSRARCISSSHTKIAPKISPNSSRCYKLLPPTIPGLKTIDIAARHQSGYSNLGLRSQHAPDSLPEPGKESPPEIPDQDWEIRTGRAIFVLQETLPDFFSTGLVTSINTTTGSPRPAPSAFTPSANVNFLEHHILDENEESIYSPNVRLCYTPPVALPSSFPKILHVEGLQMYLASASLVRHTMNALYSDLNLNIIKLVVNTPKSSSPSADDRGYSSTKRRINRDKSILVRQVVTGTARVSGKLGEWEIESTYTFSPLTGLIHEHMVNSIHPAPHQAVYDSLRSSLGKVLGLGWGGSSGSRAPNGAAFKGKIQRGTGG